jgi:hypothetical protein
VSNETDLQEIPNAEGSLQHHEVIGWMRAFRNDHAQVPVAFLGANPFFSLLDRQLLYTGNNIEEANRAFWRAVENDAVIVQYYIGNSLVCSCGG